MFQPCSWSELAAQYRRTERDLAAARENSDIVSDHELLTDMISSMKFARKEIEKKALYDLGSVSESELKLLTLQERQVAELRQKYNCKKTAEILGRSASQVHVVHKRALNKLKRIHSRLRSGIPPELTRQQEIIFMLYFVKKRPPAWIAKKLKTSIKSTENQIKIIRNLVEK
jgi:DNA-binding CsgD family transcriptional regulator